MGIKILMHKIFLITTFMFTMCCSPRHITWDVKCKNIERVLVLDAVTGEKRTIDNIAQLCLLFDDYLSTAKKDLCKFKAVYTLSFSYENKDWLIIVKANHVKINGITYVLECNLENYIRDCLMINLNEK